MNERPEAEWLARLDDEEPSVVFLYAPFCGTCMVAAKMLDVVAGMPSGMAVERVNINYTPNLARICRIESVPCLMIVQKGEEPRKLYAFESVGNVYSFLQPVLQARQRRESEDE